MEKYRCCGRMRSLFFRGTSSSSNSSSANRSSNVGAATWSQSNLLSWMCRTSFTNRCYSQLLNPLSTAASRDQRGLLKKKHEGLVCLHAANYSSEEIKIPNRIPRSPTSILEALSSTVGYDRTDISQHRLIDDPGMLSYDQRMLNRYLLAEESGKKAAKFAIDQWADHLQHDPSEPSIKALIPEVIEKADTEDSLRQHIRLNKVEQAREIYDNVSASGTTISPDTKLLYLDMLCRFNCKNVDYFEPSMETYFLPKTVALWSPEPIVEELFVELCDTHPQAYISLICGMSKYGAVKEAFDLYKETLEKDFILPAEVHNVAISMLVPVFSNFDEVQAQAENILKYMEEKGVRPNLATFNKLIEQMKQLPAFTPRHVFGLKVIKEMKRCGVEPSAGTYVWWLQLVYFTEHPRKADLLRYIVDKFTSRRDKSIRNPTDVLFMSTAMLSAETANDVETADRLYEMAWEGPSKSFFGNAWDVYKFHNRYLEILARAESLEKVMEAYRDIVPRVLVPSPKVYKMLFDLIDLYGECQHLPQIYSDMKCSHIIGKVELEKFTVLFTSPSISPQIQSELADVAEDLYQLSVTSAGHDMDKMITKIMFTHFIQLAINMNLVEKAWKWFELMVKSDDTKVIKDGSALINLAGVLIQNGDIDRLMVVLQMLIDYEFNQEVETLVEKHEELLPVGFREEVNLLRPNPLPKQEFQHRRPSKKSRKE